MKIEITHEDIYLHEPIIQYVADEYFGGDVKKLFINGAKRLVDMYLQWETMMEHLNEIKKEADE